LVLVPGQINKYINFVLTVECLQYLIISCRFSEGAKSWNKIIFV
jgi:hypothetical protein